MIGFVVFLVIFVTFLKFFGQLSAWVIQKLQEISCVHNSFVFIVITIAREECSQIPQDFGQDRVQIIPYLIEMVKVSFTVACPTVFIFTYGYYRQRGVLTFMALFKNF